MKKFVRENGRPEKPVPCPRCQSLNTKFCYFNNYNVKQPRHFCRECQRYWTAGGSLRNVPVGAGRRRHKISSSSSSTTKTYGSLQEGCHVEVSAITTSHLLSVNGFLGCSRQSQQQSESLALMTYVENMAAEKSAFTQTDQRTEKHHVGLELGLSNNESKASSSLDIELQPSNHGAKHSLCTCNRGTENEDSTCCSSVTTVLTSSIPEAASETNGAGPGIHTGPASAAGNPVGLDNLAAWWGPLMWPWLLPFWFTGGNAVPSTGNVPQVDPKIAPQFDPAFGSALRTMAKTVIHGIDPAASGLQWPYIWNPCVWSSPWNAAYGVTLSNAPSKHSPANALHEKQGSLCVPKTLRMDRAEDAAYSSILSTLGVGILPASQESNGFCNVFQPKADVFQKRVVCLPQVPQEHLHQPLHTVNPAAQARSVAFQEGS